MELKATFCFVFFQAVRNAAIRCQFTCATCSKLWPVAFLWKFINGAEFELALLAWEWSWDPGSPSQLRTCWAQRCSPATPVRPAQERITSFCRRAFLCSSSSLTSSTAKRSSVSFKRARELWRNSSVTLSYILLYLHLFSPSFAEA